MLALAHRCEESARSGEVKDYADLARLDDVSRAHRSQILNRLSLAPSSESSFWSCRRGAVDDKSIAERQLRSQLRDPRWDR